MFKNKHVITAMIVAPLLAIMSYFATDYLVADLPSAAKQGESYSLLARSNCRYESGKCTLENGDMEVQLQIVNQEPGQAVLKAWSSAPLKGARIALRKDQDISPALALTQTNENGTHWQLVMTDHQLQSQELRIAMATQDNIFFGDTQTHFFHYDTSFSRENW